MSWWAHRIRHGARSDGAPTGSSPRVMRRADISAVKAMMQKVLHDVSARALQLHGSLGTSHEMPFVQYLTESFVLGLADGPTEVHKATLARLLLKDVEPAPDVFPSEHLLRLREAAEAKFADKLAGIER